jgi:triosephosphate isomerase
MARKITMEKLIIANWKTYLSIDKAISLSASIDPNSNIIISPSMIHLAFLAEKFPNLNFAAQDISYITDNFGAYTGETPAAILNDIGVKYTIIGHSERRSNMLDNAITVKTKLNLCASKGITPIVCIGESIKDREQKIHLDVIAQQLHEIFHNIYDSDKDIIIAYEPFWAVGTGVLPLSSEIEEVITKVRKTLNFVDNRLFLVYGGSVSAENAYNLVNLDGLDGVLIGKASTDIEQFRSILKAIG